MTTDRRLRPLLLAALVLLLAAAAVLFFVFRPGKPLPRLRGANVLLLTFDTTRADRIGAYGDKGARTPAIDALAAGGVLFEQAAAPVPITLASHASVMTGLYPPSHGVRLNGKQALPAGASTIAEAFRAAGYRTGAFVGAFVLDSRFGLDQGFETYDDRMENAPRVKTLDSERRASGVLEAFRGWFDSLPADAPFFAWVHFYDPHAPYDPPEAFRRGASVADRYDGEIASMDDAVAKIVQLLAAKGVTGRTLIVAAGDHGEAFGEHGETGHSMLCYEESLRVPLIVEGPGIARGVRAPGRVSLVDVAPTVLAYAGLPAMIPVDGRSLLPEIAGRKPAPRALYFESLNGPEVLGCAPLEGIVEKGLKYIRTPRPELYDLAAGGGEIANVFASRPTDARRLERDLSALEAAMPMPAGASGRGMTEAEKRTLRSLGYVAGGSAGAVDPALDIKDRIGVWTANQKAEDLLGEGRTAEARAALEDLLRIDPKFVPALETLGDLYAGAGDAAGIRRIFAPALAANPGSASLKIALAFRLTNAGAPDEALTALAGADGALLPGDAEQFHFVRGSAAGQLGRFDEAAKAFESAVRVEPQNWEAWRLLGVCRMGREDWRGALEAFAEAARGLPDDRRIIDDVAACRSRIK